MKKVFTTGQIAKICKVAPRTVSKWFDSGRLRGYRIPGSQDRRIPRENLIRFLKEHGMPLGDLEFDGITQVLFVGSNNALYQGAISYLPGNEYKVQMAASGFEAGNLSASLPPNIVVIDFSIGVSDALSIVNALKTNLPGVWVIALLGDLDAVDINADQYLHDPLIPEELAGFIQNRAGAALVG